VIYGIFAAVAGITYILFMPETKDTYLPENLSDFLDLNKSKKGKNNQKLIIKT